MRRLLRFPGLIISAITNYRILPRPWSVTIELTGRCNSRCVYCTYWQQGGLDVSQEMTYQQYKALFDNCRQAGVGLLIFAGGEPLLRKDIFDLAQEAKQMGFKLNLNTNGLSVTDDNAPRIMDIFDFVVVSVDSGYDCAPKVSFLPAAEKAKNANDNSRKTCRINTDTRKLWDDNNFFKKILAI